MALITTAENILTLDSITRVFPGVKALDNISFSVRKGEVHALVGENGAGKSTLMHIIGGVLKQSSGRIFLKDKEVSFSSAHDAHAKGIRVVYQELSIVPNLSVAENIFANCQPVNALGMVKRGELNRQAAEMIAIFKEDIKPDILAAELPIGKRQVLEILKALTFNPRVVLLDEPTSSLTAPETQMLFKTINRLKEQGISFIFISHHLPEIFEIADRVTVLRDGVYQGTYDIDDSNENELISRMVGRTIGDIYGDRDPYPGKNVPVLEVESLSKTGDFQEITFEVRAGEILGFAGLVGAGRSELAHTLFGFNKPDRGVMRLNGETVKLKSVNDAISRGIAYLTEDRKLHGLYLSLSIRENLVSPSLSRFTAGSGILDDNEINAFSSDIIDLYSIVTPSANRNVGTLSGGNQQKVLLGMWMGTSPSLLIVDEPTRGVDVGAKEEIYQHINKLAAKGAAVILISSDLNEILGMSDRICVMRNGSIRATLSSDEASEEVIISHALGAGEAKV